MAERPRWPQVMLRDVVKTYGAVYAVNDVSLTVEDGEFVALVGPSGCGKTTTLNLVAGLIPMSGGDIYIGDRWSTTSTPRTGTSRWCSRTTRSIPTRRSSRTSPSRCRCASSPAEIDRKVREAAKVLDIVHLLERKPRELSGGQQQRVALGRALVRDPRAFLMDEPLSNLDAKLRVQMRSEIKRFHQDLQRHVIYVTHDQLEAVTMADKMAVMNGGFLQQYDTPARSSPTRSTPSSPASSAARR
jgi:multiple sugar transport system ATP-binding protein